MNIKNIEYKKNIVLNFNKLLKNDILSLILINPISLNFNDLIYIRKIIINNKFNLFMMKNSLFKKAIIDTKFDVLKNYINGPNMILYFNKKNIINYIKEIISFFKNKDLEKVKLIFIENKIFTNSKINYLYNLMTFNNSIKKFLFILNNISIINLLRTLNIIKENKNKEVI